MLDGEINLRQRHRLRNVRNSRRCEQLVKSAETCVGCLVRVRK